MHHEVLAGRRRQVESEERDEAEQANDAPAHYETRDGSGAHGHDRRLLYARQGANPMRVARTGPTRATACRHIVARNRTDRRIGAAPVSRRRASRPRRVAGLRRWAARSLLHSGHQFDEVRATVPAPPGGTTAFCAAHRPESLKRNAATFLPSAPSEPVTLCNKQRRRDRRVAVHPPRALMNLGHPDLKAVI
jgi:hypothetical protein